jgi:hypothetical protein
LREQRGRDCHVRRLGRPEIYYHLIFCWCLYRKVSRLLALEDSIDISSCTSALINYVRSEGHQAAAVIPTDKNAGVSITATCTSSRSETASIPESHLGHFRKHALHERRIAIDAAWLQ